MSAWTSLIWLVLVYVQLLQAEARVPPRRAPIYDEDTLPLDLTAASSASGAQQENPQKMKIDEDRKTLSQQVADGKYGLIQKELFSNPLPRPGVLSYESNSEVPKDNIENLGGLNKSDIWLAENHLLVLKGGVYPVLESLPEYSKPIWPPIDDYSAPRRQVKLPKHPKVPPPFPVQLTDGGPLQILGTNSTRTLNDSIIASPYPIPPMEGYDPGSGPYFPPEYPHTTNSTSGETPNAGPPYYTPIPGDKPGDNQPPQFPFPVNGVLPPFFDSLPPGSAILPPPNITDQYDEDDLSIYYPPPYSFYYPTDNTTQVPPGPLVPGIVLPPPPDFFGILKKSPEPTKSTPTTTSLPTTPITFAPPPTTAYRPGTIKPHKPQRIKPTYPKTTPITIITTTPPTVKVHQQQPQRNKSVSVTILRPVKTTTKPPTVYVYDNNIPHHQPFPEYGPPPPPHHRGKITISTTKIPLRAYFSTTSETDTNLVTKIPEKEQHTTRSALQKHRTKPPSQFYYYEDNNPATNSISTPYPTEHQTRFFNITKEYYTPGKDDPGKYSAHPIIAPLPPQYYYLPSKSYITQRPPSRNVQNNGFTNNNFNSHIAQLQEQIRSYQRGPKQFKQNIFRIEAQEPETSTPKPVYQYSFEVANYREQHDRLQVPTDNRNVPKYTVQIEPAIEITTERPIYQNTPSPIYYQQNFARNPPQRPSQPQKYYANIPDYDYQDKQKYPTVVTPHPVVDDGAVYKATPNPLYQTYYTKQDEQFFDDITKKYFTTFGKKLPTSTTPIPAVEFRPPVNPGRGGQLVYSQPQQLPNVRIQPNRPSQENIVVNYVNQRPTQQNYQPDFVPVRQPSQAYPQVSKQVPQFPQRYQPQQLQQEQKSPQSNIQTIQAISIPSRGTVPEGKPGSFISYELPGDDGAHFYFLTPQLSQKNDRGGITYYYTQPSSSSRVRRDSRLGNV